MHDLVLIDDPSNSLFLAHSRISKAFFFQCRKYNGFCDFESFSLLSEQNN
jgi:hypothetical protein